MEKITQAVINQNTPVSDLLRRVKSIAVKIDQADFVKWVDKELKGYEDNDIYPGYRELNGQVKFWNPLLGWKPVIFPNTKLEKQISTRKTKQSLPEIEDLIKSGGAEFEMPYPASVADKILTGADFRTKVSLMISKSALMGVLNAVRNELQDWLINVEKHGVEIKEDGFSEEERGKVETVEGKYQIGKIENFSGNLGENDIFQEPAVAIPKESFWVRFLWYGIIATLVIVFGNVIGGIILEWFLQILKLK